MKKLVFSGMVILLVLFLGSCGAGPGGTGSEVVPDTYVDYEFNGKTGELKLYLDGTKVPLSKSNRAVNAELALFSHDFFEVVFAYQTAGTTPTYTIARATWDIGSSAGVSGVQRGFNYNNLSLPGPTAGSYPEAAASIVMVGRKSDRTLLGVGELTHVNGVSGASMINANTTSVTFTVEPCKAYIDTDLNITGATKTPTALGGTTYPLYYLAFPQAIVGATYLIDVPNNGGVFVKVGPNLLDPLEYGTARVAKRDPRFIQAGRAFYIDSRKVLPVLSITTALAAGTAFPTAAVGFNIDCSTLEEPGVFSFFIEIPVYGITDAPTTLDNSSGTTWWVRTGYGQNLYNLDNGNDGSGCALVGIGINSLDYIEVLTEGL